MPVKRRLAKGRRFAITAEIIDLWVRAKAINDIWQDEPLEADGGRREEYIALLHQLYRALDRKPWQWNPLGVPDNGWPGFSVDDYQRADYLDAQDLRRDLNAAARGRQ